MSKLLILCLFLSFFTVNAATLEELNEKFEALSEEMLELKGQGPRSKTHFGGYGEFVYINKRSKTEKNVVSANTNNPKLDAQRFILYIGHDFSERWKLTGEIEVEHADEIFLEQGTLDYHYSNALNFQAGVMLIPVGIINLYHEPTTFHSVNRPDIDSKIIPTTWRELGVSFFGEAKGLTYRLSLVDGLKASGFSSDGVRSGRQKASQAEARDLAWVARLDYDLGGLATLGASAYFGKAGGVATDVKHDVYDLHFDSKFKGFSLRGMYTVLKLGNTDKLNLEKSLTGTNSIASQMSGYYASLGYNVLHYISDIKLTPFIRYENYNTQDKVGAGFTKDLSKERTNITYGLNLKPVDNIVFKLDYISAKNKAKTGVDSWNLGMGWNF
ncbi:MAG: porin [Halobacteriovorax sp.]|nr:porin [Halobacteriovorax sp.]|tara:strand:- start:85879 stop:87033 length:1155 start_codon:yes stop_codon:yes gene_type:complete